jgi:hypothetical protein
MDHIFREENDGQRAPETARVLEYSPAPLDTTQNGLNRNFKAASCLLLLSCGVLFGVYAVAGFSNALTKSPTRDRAEDLFSAVIAGLVALTATVFSVRWMIFAFRMDRQRKS